MSKTIIDAVNEALGGEMERDESVLVLGEDIGETGGVFRATEGLLDEFGADRVVDTPISEAGIVGVSVGLGISGYRPVAEIQFSGFLSLAFDELLTHASRVRWRTRGKYTAPIVVRTPYGGGVRPLEHHSESMEAVFAHVPGLKVVIPSSPYDTKGLLTSAIRDPGPVLFMEPKRIYRSITESVPDEQYEVPLGEAAVLEEGEDVTAISWGSMVHPTLEAAENLDDIDVEVIDLRTVSPFDRDTVLESVRKTGRAVIVHEAPKTGGFGAEIATQINEEAMFYLKAPIERVTGFDTPIPLLAMEDYYLPNPPRIEEGITSVVDT